MTTPETAMPTKPRLLVVDDEPSILKLVQTLLSRANYDVVTAPIVPVNVPSQGVARRLGFVVAGSVVMAGLFHELWVKRL
jgi:RimJ/RimL family protein N-acetyltransferase